MGESACFGTWRLCISHDRHSITVGDAVMDYASVQVMVVSLSAREAVENSIRNLIVTKSVILHLLLYWTTSLRQLLQLHTAFNNEKRPSPWTYSCPLDCNEIRQWFSLKYMTAAVAVNQRAGGMNGLQLPWWNMFFSIMPIWKTHLNIYSRMKEHLCLSYWLAAEHSKCSRGLFPVPQSVLAVMIKTYNRTSIILNNCIYHRAQRDPNSKVEFNTHYTQLHCYLPPLLHYSPLALEVCAWNNLKEDSFPFPPIIQGPTPFPPWQV